MIKGSTFRLRHVFKSDLLTLSNLINDLDLRGNYLGMNITSPARFEKTFDETKMSSEESETLLIVDLQDQILGAVSHFKSTPYFNALELGYHLFRAEHQGQGIVTEAVALLSSYLFNNKHVNRLEIRMDVRNEASAKVAVRNGFRHEGVSRGANFVRGRHVDMAVYALLRHEWEESAVGDQSHRAIAAR